MKARTPSDYDRAMVGISLLTLVPGELGGSETYVRELLRALDRVGELDYRVLLPPAAPDAGQELPAELATEYRLARTIRERLLAMGAAVARPGPLKARLRDVDVVHYPLTLRIPAVRKPSVVSLLDLQHLDMPELFSRSERAFRRVAWHRSVRSADRVIVISAFVRDRAVELLELEPERIRVVHLGVDHEHFFPGSVEREPFLLYPARRWPHKNHERLFEAFAILREQRSDLRLVLTGGGGHGALPDGVESRGNLDFAELPDLFRRASALVFPSLYEGFGQPVLEAMACGCPVACSNAASLPEIAGDAARLFDPRDPADIARATLDVLAAPDEWRRRGLEQASRFSWDATARATDAVYRELSTRS
jgi:glycosyltransferase involved in cell wall biosynthesis